MANDSKRFSDYPAFCVLDKKTGKFKGTKGVKSPSDEEVAAWEAYHKNGDDSKINALLGIQ